MCTRSYVHYEQEQLAQLGVEPPQRYVCRDGVCVGACVRAYARARAAPSTSVRQEYMTARISPFVALTISLIVYYGRVRVSAAGAMLISAV